MEHPAPTSSLGWAEVRDRLTRFAATWDPREGREQQEAQPFLIGLLDAYGIAYADLAFAPFEQRVEVEGQAKRADLLWPGHLLVEMKSATETDHLVERHLEQAYRYWENTYPHPTYVVLCSFRRLVVFEPGRYGRRIRKDLKLVDLPDQLEALDVLRGKAPDFDREAADLERDAVDAVSGLHRSMVGRGVDERAARDLTLQATWCLFAEDLGMFGEHLLESTLADMLRDQRLRAYDPLGQLFAALGGSGDRSPRYAGMPVANGALFASPARVPLTGEELELLHRAARADWTGVQPSIFGGLLQSALGDERRSAMGAHYTPEAEIQKIVGPTIVEPWEERLAAVGSAAEARAAADALAAFRVLDPACGCGNFLYVAYREIRRLHRDALLRLEQLSRVEGRAFPVAVAQPRLEHMLGIEKDEFAVALARVVLWIGHKLAIDRFELADAPLPLPLLDGIRQGDALHLPWPDTDAIVGNPPFHGASHVRSIVGDAEVDWLKSEFGVGVKDYCVYWFRRTVDHLAPGQRAGLVGTNSISQNLGRSASLDYVVEKGGHITNAVSSQVWPGDASVHVSLVNWISRPEAPSPAVLDGVAVPSVTPALRVAGSGTWKAVPLRGNRGKCFKGAIPFGRGFVIDADEAASLHARSGADYRQIVVPYLGSHDVMSNVDSRPGRWIIDFGVRGLEEAEAFPAALSIVAERVRPERADNARKVRAERWWQFGELAKGMRVAIEPLSRYLAVGAHGKRIVFAWQFAPTCPSNAVNVFALDGDFEFGVLSSRVHTEWAATEGSTIKSDPRYTPTTAFSPFPFPVAQADAHVRVSDLGRHLHNVRSRLSRDRGIGLTKIYNEIDAGGHRDLAELHVRLDRAVCEAYGWPADLVDQPDERHARLVELNRRIAGGDLDYEPFPARDASGTSALF